MSGRNGNGDLARWRGSIDEKLRTTDEKFLNLAEEMKEDREASNVYRRDINNNLSELKSSMGEVKGNLSLISATIADIKPSVQDYQRRLFEVTGAAKFGKWVYALVAAVIMGGAWIFEKLVLHSH